ncbi:putative ribonuclease H-like domain-containing protein [Tanacetum coccineum]
MKTIEQLHDDDLEEMDLKWNMALLSMRARKAPRSKDNRNWNQGSSTKTVKIKDASEKAMRVIDGVGFDWSDMAEEEIQANMALMVFLDSESDNSMENTDDFLEQHQMTDTKTSSFESLLKVDKDWKEKFFYPANHVSEVEPKKVRKNNDAPIIEDWVSDDEDEDEFFPVVVKKQTVIPTAAKIEKPVRKPVRYAEMYRPSYTAHPKSTVLCARPKTHFQNQAQSTVQRPFYKKTALTKRSNNQNINTCRQTVNTVRPNVNTVRARGFNVVKPSACWVWRPIKPNGASLLNDKGFVNSGCSRHMSGNIAHLSDFKEFDGGYVTFGGGANGGRITGKGTVKTDKLDFEDLPDENQILLKIPRQDNMYSFDMKNIVPKDGLTCLVAKATSEESMLWHRRLGHVNFKNINKLVKENLVRDLPLKRFENDQTCVACLKGKQHRASCKTKAFNPITKPLFMLHMDLFGPTFVSSLMHKKYCLVVTDDYSRFSWVFFLRTKDETSEILKNFIKEVENLVDKKVKIIRSDNGTEFKNKVMDEFCREKGIKISWAKFDGKSDDGFCVGDSLSSKLLGYTTFETRKLQENLHVGFLENNPIVRRKWYCKSSSPVPSTRSRLYCHANLEGWRHTFDDASPQLLLVAQIQVQDGTNDDWNHQYNGY